MRWWEYAILAVIGAVLIICGYDPSRAATGDTTSIGPPFGFGVLSGVGGEMSSTRPKDQAILEGRSSVRVRIIPGSKRVQVVGPANGGHIIKNTAGDTLVQQPVLRCYSGVTCAPTVGETRIRVFDVTTSASGLMSAASKKTLPIRWFKEDLLPIKATAATYKADGSLLIADQDTIYNSASGDGATFSAFKTYSGSWSIRALFVNHSGHTFASPTVGAGETIAEANQGLWRHNGTSWARVLGSSTTPYLLKNSQIIRVVEDGQQNLYAVSYTATWNAVNTLSTATMTASSGATTFTTSAPVTFQTGDVVWPATNPGTSYQYAVRIASGGTGTSFTVTAPFATNISDTFYTRRPAQAAVFKSTNHGATWSNVLDVPSHDHFHSLTIDPVTDWIYIASGETIVQGNFVSYPVNGEPFIYRSKDHGVTWDVIFTKDSGRDPQYFRNFMGINVYNGVINVSPEVNGGMYVYRGVDSGGSVTWTATKIGIYPESVPRSQSWDIVRNPNTGTLIYFNSNKLFGSTDAGLTWKLLKTYNGNLATSFGQQISQFYNNTCLFMYKLGNNPITGFWGLDQPWEYATRITEIVGPLNEIGLLSVAVPNTVPNGATHTHLYGDGGVLNGVLNNFGLGTITPSYPAHVEKEWASPASTNITVAFDSYGDNARFIGRRANGTKAAPSKTLSGQGLSVFGGRSHDGANFNTFSNAGISVVSTEDGDSGAGTKLSLFVTANGAAANMEGLVLTSDAATFYVPLVGDGSQLTGIQKGLPYNKTEDTTGAAYTLQAGDMNKILRITGANGVNTGYPTIGTVNDTVWIHNAHTAAINVTPTGTSVVLDGSTSPVSVPAGGDLMIGIINATNWYTLGKSGSGTAITASDKQVIFSDGANNPTGAASLYWDKTNSRVGIGSSSPARQFHASSEGNNSTRGIMSSSHIDTATANQGGMFLCRRSQGTAASPTALASGDVICQLQIEGATGAGTYDSSRRAIEINADEAWTGSTGAFNVDIYTRITGALGAPSLRVRFPSDGGLRLASATEQTCDAAHRGTINYVAGGAGVTDTLKVCTKDAADAYGWRALY